MQVFSLHLQCAVFQGKEGRGAGGVQAQLSWNPYPFGEDSGHGVVA